MIKQLVVGAACLAVTCLSGTVVWACDEDCAYEMREAAYEQAYDHAEARAEAAEEGYSLPRSERGASRSAGRRESAGRGAAVPEEPRKPAQTRAESRVAEQRSETPTRSEPQRQSKGAKGVLNENSSIASGSRSFAEDDTYDRPVSRKAVGCKTYFPSVGMTVSVPCD